MYDDDYEGYIDDPFYPKNNWEAFLFLTVLGVGAVIVFTAVGLYWCKEAVEGTLLPDRRSISS